MLAAVAALTVALPLGQVLREQQDELKRIATRRAALDPLVRAVDVQRGLLAHRDIAAAVLRGRLDAEPERRRRQGDVDGRLTTLAIALTTGPWDRALRESDALRDDWQALAQRIAARRIGADDSQAAHRQLVEQLLVVVDILDAARNTGLADGPAVQALAALHGLPRQALLRSEGGALLDRYDAAAQAAVQALGQARGRVEQARTRLLAAMAALVLLGVLVAWPLRRRPGPQAAAAGSEPDADAGRSPGKQEVAAGLFGRLRGSDTAAAPLDSRLP